MVRRTGGVRRLCRVPVRYEQVRESVLAMERAATSLVHVWSEHRRLAADAKRRKEAKQTHG